MVGKEVGPAPHEVLELGRRAIGRDELVDDGQPMRVTQRRVAGGAPGEIDRHIGKISPNNY